ncbi:MAG: hypothetical protein QM765_06770 [Myxococcales bacterium]
MTLSKLNVASLDADGLSGQREDDDRDPRALGISSALAASQGAHRPMDEARQPSRKELALWLGAAAWCLLVAQAFLPWWLEHTGERELFGQAFDATVDSLRGFQIGKLLANVGWLVAAVATTAGASGYGEALLRILRLPATGRWTRELFAAALGLGVLGTLVLGMGLAGLLGGWLWLAIAPAAALRAWFWFRPVALAPRPAREPLGLGGWAIVGACGVLLLLVWTGASAPVTDVDSLMYHLALPKAYLAAGRIDHLPTWLHSTRSLLTEMVYLVGLGLGGEALARMLGLVFTLLAVAAVGLTVARFSSAKAAAASCLVFLSVPAVLEQASVTSTDVSVCLYATLSLAALLEWDSGLERAWWWLSALLGGLTLACKYTGALAIAPLAVFVAVRALKQGRPGAAARAVAGWAAIAALVMAPWLVRAFWWTGNPVWPFGYAVLGGKDWNAMLAREAPVFWSEPYRLARAGEAWRVFPRLVQANFERSVGFLLPALLPLGLLRRSRITGFVGGFVAFTFVAWFLVSQQVRFLLPTFAAISILVGLALQPSLSRIARRGIAAVIGVGVLVTALWAWGSFSRDFRIVFGGQKQEQYFARFPAHEAAVTANRLTPPDARVLLMWDSQGYYVDRTVLWGDPLGQGYFDYCSYSAQPTSRRRCSGPGRPMCS